MKRTFVGALLLCAVATIALTAIQHAFAQFRPGDVQRGRAIAERVCVACHAIAPDGDRGVRSDVPTFAAIANREKATPEYLAGRIIIPHPPMPDTSLTVDQVRDVVAYILSLKRAN